MLLRTGVLWAAHRQLQGGVGESSPGPGAAEDLGGGLGRLSERVEVRDGIATGPWRRGWQGYRVSERVEEVNRW